MEQMQQTAIPHLVQVYQQTMPNTIHISHPTLPPSQGKLTYQQSMSSEIPLPISSHHVTEIQTRSIHISQNQLVMSCQQGLQGLQPLPSQSQVMQSSDMTQSLQIASHVLLPQHMLVNGIPPFYSQYEYPKENYGVTQQEQSLLCKLEPEMQLVVKDTDEISASDTETSKNKKKRPRSQKSNPTSWACNVRKLKHQQGEAYINRRGKFVPERQIRNTKDCLKSCKYKCSEKITDKDRENIFKAFYSLNTNEKRFFLLNSTERIYIKQRNTSAETQIRKHSFKYFFTLHSEKHMVCKQFYLGTLAISQKPVYNVHMSKTDFNIPKPDERGHNKASTHSLPVEVKERVRKHISSFKTIDSKPVVQNSKKKQLIDLSMKQMYNMYFGECSGENIEPVKESMYRKILKADYNLYFHKVKSDSQLCGRCKGSIKKK